MFKQVDNILLSKNCLSKPAGNLHKSEDYSSGFITTGGMYLFDRLIV